MATDKMDLAQAFDPPITETINNEPVTFPVIPLLKLSQVLSVKAKTEKKNNAQKIINDNKLWGEDRLLMLKDANYFSIDDLQNYVNSLDGAIQAVTLSLEIAGKSKEEISKILDDCEPFQLVRIANLTTGFMVYVEPSADEKKTVPPVTQPTETPPTEPKGFGDV